MELNIKNKLFSYKILPLLLFLSIVLGVTIFFFRKQEKIEVTIQINPEGSSSFYKQDPYSWYANKIKVGMKEKDGLGLVKSEIIKVERLPLSNDSVDTLVKARISVTHNYRNDQYVFNTRTLLIGSSIVLNVDNTLVTGVILDINGDNDNEYISKTVNLSTIAWNEDKTIMGIDPASLGKVSIGDKITYFDDTIAEILDFKENPGIRIVTTNDGRVIQKEDPYFKRYDFKMKLKVKKTSFGNTYFVNRFPLRVGEWLPLFFSDKVIWGTIISVEH